MKQSNPTGDRTSMRETLLLVDDEDAVRRVLYLKLSREGYKCEEANGAEQALHVLETVPVALVLLDIKMPDKSGIELLPEIKETYPDVAVIMATAVNNVDIAVQCLKQGADDYTCKPFNLDDVSLAVQRVLHKRRLQIDLREYQQFLEKKVEEQMAEMKRLFLGAIDALVSALEAKDKYTGGHSRRVTEIAVAVGKELGLPTQDMEDLRWGSLLHDVGKIAIHEAIQNKPGALTSEEYEHIMIHTEIGARIVRAVVNGRITDIIEHHHDRYDGTGLHQVVAGNAIPLGARIVAVADAFDAMTSDRPYRSAMSRKEALDEIKRSISTQFDPVVADALLRVMSRQSEAHDLPYQVSDAVMCATLQSLQKTDSQ
jgi:putative two-component system response regulator